MKPKKYKIYLNEWERKQLESITKRGKHPSATVRRANILLRLDENQGQVDHQATIANQLCTTTTTIYNVSKQFVEEGIEAALYRKQRETPPIQPIATGEIEARIIALACSEPPKGRSRWTLRLLEEKVIELRIVDAISDNTIGRLLKKHRLSLI
jgi:transposase